MGEKEQLEPPQAASIEDDSVKASAEMRYLARQPIFDAHSRLLAYELLFQLNSDGPAGGYGKHATRATLDNILLYGLDKLANNMPAFLTCSGEAMVEPFVTILPPEKVILGIPEQLEFYPKMIGACRKLKEMGYRLALENFSWGTLPHVLLPTVDYVKFNPAAMTREGLERLHRAIAGTSTVLLAEAVNSQEEYKRAVADGFTYFQGFYFCHPEFIQKTKVPGNKLFHVEILRQLRNDPLDLKKIEPLVKRDTGLVYRLLRLANSPLCALRQEIHSVEIAILTLGETTFRRIAMLAVLSELNAGQPAEILHMTLARARFCELAAPSCGLDSEEQYLLGMLSLLPAMLRQPMGVLVQELPLRAEIRNALLGEANKERCLLAWIEAHERYESSKALALENAFNLNAQRLEQFYVDAIVWESLATGLVN